MVIKEEVVFGRNDSFLFPDPSERSDSQCPKDDLEDLFLSKSFQEMSCKCFPKDYS